MAETIGLSQRIKVASDERIKRRYKDLEALYSGMHLDATKFSPAVKRLKVESGTLPAVVVRGPVNEALPETLKNRVVGDVGKMLGDQGWLEKIQLKLGNSGHLSGERTNAGYGHRYEEGCITNTLTALGLPVLSFNAEDVIGKTGDLYKMKLAGHKAVQFGRNVLSEITEEKLIHELFADNVRAYIASFGFSLVGLADASQKTRPEDTFKNFLPLYKQILKLTYYLNYQLFDKKFVEALDIFREKMNVVAGHSANVANVRRIRKNERGPHTKIVPMSVDVGYPRLADGKITAGSLVEFVNWYGAMTVPDMTSAEVMAKYYDVHGVFIVGDNVGQIVDERRALEKWNATKKDRMVLISTSGHGANADELSQIMEDFVLYRKENSDSPYTCILFTGHNKDNSLNVKLNHTFETARRNNAVEINVTWETDFKKFKKSILNNKGKLILVRTEDNNLTGFVKLWLEEVSNVEAIKSGEAHSINPHTATLTSLLTPAPPNEPLNGIFALLTGGSIPRSAVWIDYVRGYFKNLGYDSEKIEEIVNSIPGLKYQPENYFKSLDYYWGDRKEGREKGENVVFHQVMEGFLNMKNSTLPVIAMEAATALGLDLEGDFGRRLKETIVSFHAKERERKLMLIDEVFPKSIQAVNQKEKQKGRDGLIQKIMLTAISLAAGMYLGSKMSSKTTVSN